MIWADYKLDEKKNNQIITNRSNWIIDW